MQTAEVAIAPIIKVILKTDAKALDEVVVTAMGISKEKKALGYAVQDVKGDKQYHYGQSSHHYLHL